jgi:hypothetical protein
MDEIDLRLLLIIRRVTVKWETDKACFLKIKTWKGHQKAIKYAPAILSSLDLSFTIHSSQSQSHDTIPLNTEAILRTLKAYWENFVVVDSITALDLWGTICRGTPTGMYIVTLNWFLIRRIYGRSCLLTIHNTSHRSQCAPVMKNYTFCSIFRSNILS